MKQTVVQMKYFHQQNLIVTTYSDQSLTLHSVNKSQQQQQSVKLETKAPRTIYSVCLISDLNLVAGGDSSGAIQLWHVSNLKEAGQLVGHTSKIHCLLELPRSRMASGGWDSSIIIWDIRSFKMLTALAIHSSLVTAMILVPTTEILVSGSFERQIGVSFLNVYE